MNTINIGLPTLENMDAAMASVGFTKDTTLSTASASYYKWESSGEIELCYTDNGQVYYYDTARRSITSLTTSTNAKLCYETLSNGGLAIGWSQDATTPLQCAFVAPSSAGDSWVFFMRKDGAFQKI